MHRMLILALAFMLYAAAAQADGPATPAPPTAEPAPPLSLVDQMRGDWQGATALLARFIGGYNTLIVNLQKQIDDGEAQKATLIEWLKAAQAREAK